MPPAATNLPLPRRRVLELVGLGGGGLAVFPCAGHAQSVEEQNQWRFCFRCHAMYYDGYSDKGVCPAGFGGHAAAGYNFTFEYSARRTQELPGRARQYDWRFCNKCHVMFFDGYPTKGVCPRGGAHVAQGFMFGLWDVNGPSFPGSPMQADWRFCNKCDELFFDGYPDKGHCAAGGGHAAQGLNFKIFFVDSNPPATPPPLVHPSITVSHQSGGAFVVAGSGFVPGNMVYIRVADDYLNPNLFFSTKAFPTGAISQTLAFPCRPGVLHFSAHDDRKDPSDGTGILWSNTFNTTC